MVRRFLLAATVVLGLTLGSGITPVGAAPAAPEAPSAVTDYPASCDIAEHHRFSGVRGNEAFIIVGGQTMWRGQQCQIGKARLVMQWDGNLVVYDEHGAARWASNTYGLGYRADFQWDGNFVVYGGEGQVRWASNTYVCCTSNRRVLSIQSDGNVVIYDHNGHLGEPQHWTHIWATDTYH
jgi:hypothetical protein